MHTFQSSVKGKTPGANDEIAKECDKEYAIMAILPAIEHALEGEVDE